VKDAQGQMRHSRATATLDIYQQFVPESQRRVVDRLSMLTTSVAQCNLAAMYFVGPGKHPNHEQSARWFRAAAEQGVVEA